MCVCTHIQTSLYTHTYTHTHTHTHTHTRNHPCAYREHTHLEEVCERECFLSSFVSRRTQFVTHAYYQHTHSVYTTQCLYHTVSVLHSVYTTQCLYHTVSVLHSVCTTQCLYHTVSVPHSVCTQFVTHACYEYVPRTTHTREYQVGSVFFDTPHVCVHVECCD